MNPSPHAPGVELAIRNGQAFEIDRGQQAGAGWRGTGVQP